MNIATFDQLIVLLIVLGAAAWLTRYYIRKHKKAKESGNPCAGGCPGCPSRGTCSIKPPDA